MLKPAFAALAEAAQPQILWAALVAGGATDRTRLPVSLRGYDFVAFTDNRPVPAPANRCLTPFFLRPTFQIFAVVDDADCTKSNG
jgi:hypothetical protein